MTDYEIHLDQKPDIETFFDAGSSTFSYLVIDPETKKAAIYDSVLDLDYASGRIDFEGADKIIARVQEHGLHVEWIIETHVHADHLSAAPYLQEKLGGKIGIGEQILEVQDTFGKIFNEGTEFQRDGSQFDKLFTEGDTYQIGNLNALALHAPGHTPACMVHVVGDAAFVGDTLFMPDSGSARADFPGGDAGDLYDSIQKVLSLPQSLRLFMCHDYAPNGREHLNETTVGEQRENNIHVGANASRKEFVKLRTERDATLNMPKLILPSLQVNMRAGHMPTDGDGKPMLKVPINAL